MKTTAKRIIPSSLIPYCQTAWRIRRTFLRRLDCRTLSREGFISQLKELGFTQGATIYLHSSMDEFSRRVPCIDPFKLISMLKELIGEEGTMLMPTFPFEGSQYYYVQTQKIFDVTRAPSKVGLLTELFRRSKGVIRSLHPTHPIAAWGKHSRELVAEHHLGTAFGKKSPIFKMQQYNGLVASIGVQPRRCFTLYHMAEELHPKSRAMHYSADKFETTIINGEEKITYYITPLRPDRKRIYDRADRILQKEKILHYYTVKGLKFGVTHVDKFLKRSMELIDMDMYYGK
ncbi:MAG: AAC(3) family N-acetyltransferase [Candidatus Scalindua sp.]|nr:AAC(3) family N-acetyltransferase [Candidatus Scalindua sp.]